MLTMRAYALPVDDDRAGQRDYFALETDETSRRRRARATWSIRLLIALVVFTCGFFAGEAFAGEPSVRFVQPRSAFVLAPPTGTVIPVQLRIEPNAENRSYAIAWCDGSDARALDGADASAIQPAEAPLNVRVAPGDCAFSAVVFGADGHVRARTSFTVHVCGGQAERCGGQP